MCQMQFLTYKRWNLLELLSYIDVFIFICSIVPDLPHHEIHVGNQEKRARRKTG